MSVGERLKQLRKSFGYKLKQVAAGASVDLKIYQAYEAGRARTPINVLLALSEFYGFYSVDKLLGLSAGSPKDQDPVMKRYHALTPEKRKIVDYILYLEN
jgi:transcriptional regulator with XRE-family HTH domain